MFEKSLSEKFRKIFDLKKITYEAPSASQEQKCLFINIQSSKNAVKDKLFVGKATGKINVFASLDELPYGYFSKAISKAHASDIEGLFFYDFEENQPTIDKICERSASFIYFFSLQYDPDLGEITSANINVGLQ